VAWANTADTQIFVALGNGVEKAASERGLDYVTALAAGDPARNVDQLRTFLGQGVGAIVVQPLDQAAQQPVLEQAVDDGVCVEGIITFPSSLQVAAPQYDIGYAQGRGAAQWAQAHLGGRADVHYFNQDNISGELAVRHRGVLDGLRTGGSGIRVVSDFAPTGQESIDTGFAVMVSVIQAHPGIKIVLGGDTYVVGAYRALQQVGKLTEDMYLAGVDGDANALELVKEGGPYRASFAFPWSLMGFGMGQFAADWIAGKSVPRVMVALARQLSSAEDVARYLDDNAHPDGVFADRRGFARYLPLRGNVNHAMRHTVWKAAYHP
jgi:ribose transport system substrate-binding protein